MKPRFRALVPALVIVTVVGWLILIHGLLLLFLPSDGDLQSIKSRAD